MTELAAGLVLGLASSAHCAAMCGPLMIAWRQRGGLHEVRELALYHLSRITVYAVFGAAAGAAGGVLTNGGFARGLSIVSGVLLMITAAGRAGVRVPAAARLGPAAGRLFGANLARVRALGSGHPAVAATLAGGANALLPCGVLYAAIIAAAAVAAPVLSAGVMVMYGLGTTPALAGIWWSSGLVTRLGQRRLAYVPVLVLALTGAALIGRGILSPHQHTPRAVSAAEMAGHRH